MSRTSYRGAALVVALSVMVTTGCKDLQTGLVAGLGSTEILAIDVSGDTTIGTVVLPGSISSNQALPVAVWPLGTPGVVGMDSDLYVLDIDGSGVSQASGSPIALTGRASMVETRWPLPWAVTGGSLNVSVVDLGAMTEASTLGLTVGGITALALCDDGQSILVATIGPTEVKRLALTSSGVVSDPGETTLAVTASTVGALDCAPGGQAGAMITNSGAEVVSFTITVGTGLQEVDRVDSAARLSGLPGSAGNEATFSWDGTGLFVRSSITLGSQQQGWVERYEIDAASGAMTATPVFTGSVGTAGNASGLSRIGEHPDGDRIYVPEDGLGQVEIWDATNGSFIGTITHSGMAEPLVTHVSGRS